VRPQTLASKADRRKMAVYTVVSDKDLETFVAAYDIGELLSCKGIAEGVENTNYLIQTNRGHFILTLYEKRVAADDLPFFLNLMEFLAEAGIPSPTPLHGRDGRALRTLCDRPAAIITFLNGMSPNRMHTGHCAGVGAALARLHNAGADFDMSRPNRLSVNAWRPLFDASAARADEVLPGLAEILSKELDFLEANWPNNLPEGVCHADLFPDNVFFLGDELSGLIDFYFACNDFLVYDLAICLNAWCFERDNSFNVTKARRMLTAYRRERSTSDAEIAALPIIARGAAIRFLLTRLYDWLNHPKGAFVKLKDPREYLSILQFHQRVSVPGEYGID
jgi:homoserine kinase type II